jgi:phenylpyruvate tautomerase PptA (4-oxalocrotonate tautomerase family)
MPRVKIETTQPLDRTSARELMDDVMDVIVKELLLLPDDRNVSFVAHDPDFFRMKPPYSFFIEIALFRGRSKEVKSRLYQAIVGVLLRKHRIDPGAVMIVLNEQPRENWGLRGGLRGDEIDLGYRVDI